MAEVHVNLDSCQASIQSKGEANKDRISAGVNDPWKNIEDLKGIGYGIVNGLKT